MQTVRQLPELRDAISGYRAAGERVAFVPTMGALHAGHMALVAEAKLAGNRVVVSIFVNPKQFGPNEDLAKYPRKEQIDSRMLSDAGVDLLWLPPVEVMYPEGHSTNISVAGVSEPLDGAARPGHFDGVATVVAKLFNQVKPDVALFGEKDFQQLAVIRRMVADLDFDIDVRGVPTQRDDDGLALSSRNVYLMPEDRTAAVALPRALGVAARAIEKGDDTETALATARASLEAAGFEVDYVELADAETLGAPVAGQPRRLLAAARIGGTRLIDNIAVEPA
ncbi:pantoate--beta-alanine ligase [Sphingomonas koreensis]|uniref:pantoate--beta-alanine ligase n=1 Tax=Sphingomonas koreensis TaxID=93064 RepID=UPI00082CF84C|nr:pantoate--beta-alanine ligase [Sphingomonas koreensis]PJI89146.1 pantoate--beta-alanine ligase [Sphingomonas koreensis]RSU59653.1 pantoate--beta-alanine ligase [Sphingomonas koreensis]RSU70949.1 pantoate--beta-alanine ligase [Sphingomonas koreensis]